jgi:hypothetical protein
MKRLRRTLQAIVLRTEDSNVAMYRICAVCIACGDLLAYLWGRSINKASGRPILIKILRPDSRAEVRASALP